MDKLTKLVRQVNRLAYKAENDNVIQMMYDGEVIAEYKCDCLYEPDCKTPEQWVRGCSCFEISLKHRDIEKVTLRMV